MEMDAAAGGGMRCTQVLLDQAGTHILRQCMYTRRNTMLYIPWLHKTAANEKVPSLLHETKPYTTHIIDLTKSIKQSKPSHLYPCNKNTWPCYVRTYVSALDTTAQVSS